MLQLSFVRFKKGTYLFVEGKADQGIFYIIQSGYVRCKSEDSIPGAPESFGPGDFVGVISCMSNHAHVESIIATSDVVAIMVRKEQYPELIAQNTPVAMKIIRSFAARMRVLNEHMMQQTLKTNAVVSPEQIFSVANCYEKLGKLDIATYAYYQYLKACPTGRHFPEAKARFVALKPKSEAVYFEPNADLVRSYPRDTMIFSEFQSGSDMFIIQSGQVKISKVVNGNEVVLAMLKKGDMFGEMALLENMPRSASAIANEPCQLMTVNHQNFDKMVATQPQLISRLTNTFADRIWSMYRQLANT
ncbi:MAG: cyclic nucleotide-binding domain-containing protein, partial [Treponema sp.]|nr:cyclic nucleotide-binding domain-containing protein [Treponema sp.]